MSTWTFLTNHAYVLACIAADPRLRIRDIAPRVKITERAAQRIVAELVDGGYVKRKRVGRRNEYEINPDRPLRHPMGRETEVGELLDLVT